MEMTTRAGRLAAFARSYDGAPVTWGRDDCSAQAAAWLRLEAGVHVALPAYDDRQSAAAVVEAGGGLEACWRAALAEAGVAETTDPQPGDVGLIDTSLGPVGVLVAAGGWVLWRTERGLTALRPRRFLATWSCP